MRPVHEVSHHGPHKVTQASGDHSDTVRKRSATLSSGKRVASGFHLFFEVSIESMVVNEFSLAVNLRALFLAFE